ncbi:MAG TPA: nicotinate phosphoribosyltransferase [Gammaproteobacteria bacterium]|nr:nicotinate phosphoribosyltransferase [Gammaproteobacteria bacterium]
MTASRVPALFTDLYELTMLQAYRAEGMTGPAVFDVFARTLPKRNFLLACGLEQVLDYLESFAVSGQDIDYLRSLGRFRPDFLEYLRALRFTGTVYAMAEGTPAFAHEPLLTVEAPMPEAQFVETAVLNLLHYPTLVASKGVRVTQAAQGRAVVDFGARRAHGVDAAIACARALHIVGYHGTSNVEAGRRYGIPVAGTVAHSYVQAHASEAESFARFVAEFPGTTLLVDTYDTLDGVRQVIDLARRLGDRFQVSAVRLDSGDLAALARAARALLDEAGMSQVRIMASGGLDEHAIAALLADGAPIDGFGVGTTVDVAADRPYLDAAYKLVAYDGRDCGKLSPGKVSLPGPKQVYRIMEGNSAIGDVIARRDEAVMGEPLLHCVMRKGCRLPSASPGLSASRAHLAAGLDRLPARLQSLSDAAQPYPVAVSQALLAAQSRFQQLHSEDT